MMAYGPEMMSGRVFSVRVRALFPMWRIAHSRNIDPIATTPRPTAHQSFQRGSRIGGGHGASIAK
jgi:hypothetical protein